ncbi:MAG: transketolase [Alphaproteobacteria bacterium]|nr:transketolase [Alphaproteobacteria bacterium]
MPSDDNTTTGTTAGTSAGAVRRDQMANAIRALSMDAIQAANSGHPGMPMGMADVATVLFDRHLKFDPANPNWPDRDRFVLSAGHGSMLLYSLLYLTGYKDIDIDEIRNFRQLGRRTAGHPEYGHAAGIETTTGPLGQGIGNGVGMALAERMMAARHGDDLVDHHTYVIAGDGCLMEGISHEAASLAGHLKLNKLIVLFDDNGICIDGPTNLTVGDDQCARFQSYGWNTAAIDGHDKDAVDAAITAAKTSDRPTLIACKTIIGFGAPNKQGTSATHGAALGDAEIAAAREFLNWPHAPFDVPDDILANWREAGARGAAQRAAWGKVFDGASADAQSAFQSAVDGDLPSGWETAINDFKKAMSAERPKLATRQASQKTLNVLNGVIPTLAGGSADLTGSNLTLAEGMTPVSPEDYSGSYIYYGVREHAMASAMNGIALHGGLVPYGATFLIFTDYCKPAIRLSALMEQRVIYVMTHDSIGLGEDGPTHQPVEQLAGLRAIPNLMVMRPADVVETAECWALAMNARTTPSVIALTRQGVPTVREEHTDENLSARGGYILREAEGDRKVTLLATGSEVEIALNARDMLQKDGIGAAVVSMPCHELFDQQDESYRDQVLGPDTVRIGVEAAVSQGWDRYLGAKGGFVGMTGFGASAPIGDLYNLFGITAEKVVEAAKSHL